MKIGRGILFFYFSVLTCQVFPQDYNFRNFTTEDNLSQSFIYSILQDSHGYLWIGTGGGLSRFNGFIFENYTTSDSLADNFITCAINDGESLWFGHITGQLSYYDGKVFHPVNIPQSGLSPVTHFTKSQDDQIWGSTFSDGLLKLNRDTVKIKSYTFKDQVLITTFEFFNDSELLVGTSTGLLYCRLKEPGEIEIIRTIAEIPESKITSVRKMKNKSGFYIATENDGIFRLLNEDSTINITKIIADQDFDFAGIKDIFEDSEANLWLCSFGNGLIKMNYSASGELKNINYLNNSGSYPIINIQTVYEDREGIIWSGSYGEGLTQITPKTFSVYKFNKDLYGNDIFSLWFDQQYRWIGTENGLIKLDQSTGRIVNFYSKGSGLPKDTITAIHSSDGGELWIGTEKNGVFRMDPESEKILKYPIANGALENSITSITGKGDDVWIGTKKGLCNINKRSNEINWYSINQGGLPHNSIMCLYLDTSDILWISTPGNTLTCIKDKRIFKTLLRSTGGILRIVPVTEDAYSQIWVGSMGNGVFKIDADSVFNFTTKEGLLSDYCYSIICDDNKNIWVGHKGGLSRIRMTDFSVKPINQIEGINESYQFNPNAITKDRHGKIWFGTDKGLISYDQTKENPRLQPPALGFTSIKINDDPGDYTDKIILSPGNYKIRFDFLGISLKEPALVTYQYQLKGYDPLPEITKETNITYNHLTEGNFELVLSASSGDGAVTVSPLTINLIIKKPVWKKLWFYMINLLLMIILTGIYIKRREYKLLAEKKILEEKVRERTYEIQCQKNEIELQRDTIEEKNFNITSSIMYASNIQNALLPPVEHIDLFLPDNFIFSRPRDIVSGDFYWLAEKDNKIIFTVADGTGHGVPGAFISLLGITLLNEIVNIRGITTADAILSNLRDEVTRALMQGRKDISTSDGMDIALCVLDRSQSRIQFSGGMNNLVFIRDKKLQEVKGNRFSVCASPGIWSPFTLNEFECRKGDVYYLFSDGYQDQFGGNYDKKFLRQHFYLTLMEIHEKPLLIQKELLGEKLDEWKKENCQTDDITIMGVRL